MKNTEYRFYVREFLNRPGHHSTGHILAYVEKSTPQDKWSRDVNFTLADCSRQIDFSFELRDKDARENSLYKIDLLIRSLQQFRKAFKAECELQDDRDHLAARLAAEKRKKVQKIGGATNGSGSATLAEVRQKLEAESSSASSN